MRLSKLEEPFLNSLGQVLLLSYNNLLIVFNFLSQNDLVVLVTLQIGQIQLWIAI